MDYGKPLKKVRPEERIEEIYMQLNIQGLKEKEQWEKKGYKMPIYDRSRMIKKTKERPFWIHFGAGNIFRAFQANVVQHLLEEKVLDRGLIVAEGYDYEIIEKMNRPHDDLSILVTLKADGSIQKDVVGSVAESLCLDRTKEKEYARLKEIFRKESLQMATFTITEKGYSLLDGKGEALPQILEDYGMGPIYAESYMGKVTALLYERFCFCHYGIAFVSMDNCSHNGEKLFLAVSSFAKEWGKRGLVEKGFYDYVCNPSKVSFPWTMIDKITPRPDEMVYQELEKDEIEDLQQTITQKKTYVAPFVNAEECEYLVIEDNFPNGREALEKGGFLFTNRETVEKVERMKVCTCLNPLHTALAVFGCLLDYYLISEEMQNPILRKLVYKIGYDEGLPVVTNPGIIEPKNFIDQVVQIRIPNPFMPDTPQRIATDTSQKLGIRYGETIKAYINSAQLSMKDLVGIPLVFAGWLRYLMGIDDKGRSFEPSPDPMLAVLCPIMSGIHLGDRAGVIEKIAPILTNEKIFGVNLSQVGLEETVTNYFLEMIAGEGAVEETLKKYI